MNITSAPSQLSPEFLPMALFSNFTLLVSGKTRYVIQPRLRKESCHYLLVPRDQNPGTTLMVQTYIDGAYEVAFFKVLKFRFMPIIRNPDVIRKVRKFRTQAFLSSTALLKFQIITTISSSKRTIPEKIFKKIDKKKVLLT